MQRSGAVLMAIVGTLAAACSGGSKAPADSASPSANAGVQVVVVNYEIVAQLPNRLLVGLVLPDGRLVAYGSVQMRFTPLDKSGQPSGPTSQVVEGTYLAVPGTDSGDPNAEPGAISPDTARGVYVLEGVRFGGAGPWAVEIVARVQDAGTVQGSARFEVLAEPSAPGVGERAPRSDNAVIGDRGIPLVAIDSRAGDGGAIPDPELHRVSIADSISAKRPTVVVFSTPVYCFSRFCGPVTDMVQGLARTYRGRANFIHVEVWRDFQRSIANRTANEWIDRNGTLTEPWLFVIGADGRIVARWDNLFTRDQIAPVLDELLTAG